MCKTEWEPQKRQLYLLFMPPSPQLLHSSHRHEETSQFTHCVACRMGVTSHVAAAFSGLPLTIIGRLWLFCFHGNESHISELKTLRNSKQERKGELILPTFSSITVTCFVVIDIIGNSAMLPHFPEPKTGY